MIQSTPMTRTGYNKIKADIERMEHIEMPAIAEKIGVARAEGDLKENAEYHAQRENQGMLQAKINQLKAKLSTSVIIDISEMPKGEIAFGSTVVVKDLEYDDEEKYTLVGAGEEDYTDIEHQKILITSPIGQGLLGSKVGEKVEIEVPQGKLKFEVVSISYEEMG